MAQELRLDQHSSVKVPEGGPQLVSWLDKPEFALSGEDFRTSPQRTVRRFVLHTTMGVWPQRPVDGAGESSSARAENVARYWRRNKSSAAAHLISDIDGQLIQCHYLVPIVAWHANIPSLDSIGLECVQPMPSASVYRASAKSAAWAIDAVIRSGHAQIGLLDNDGTLQVRTSYPDKGLPAPVIRGVAGHCHVSPNDRGRGDPGDFLLGWVADELEALSRGLYRVRRT